MTPKTVSFVSKVTYPLRPAFQFYFPIFCWLQEKCCGAYNYTDYKTISWSQNVMHNNQSVQLKVPISCCKKNSTAGDIPKAESDFENLRSCMQGVATAINDQVMASDVNRFLLQGQDQYFDGHIIQPSRGYYHRVRGSASPVVKVTSHFNGKLENLTPRISQTS